MSWVYPLRAAKTKALVMESCPAVRCGDIELCYLLFEYVLEVEMFDTVFAVLLL